jgi:oligoendopeptidase F
MAATALLKRSDIERKYTWQLSDIYPSDEAWEADFKRAQELIDSARQFTGRLAESPATMYHCLSTQSELGIIVARLYQYAHLNKDLDNRVSKYQAMTERAAVLGSQGGAAFAFVEPELLTIDEARLVEMSRQFPKTDEYDFFITELIRSKAHIRSAEVEELLAMSTTVARSADNIFTMLDDADLTYPVIKDEQGQDVQLSKQRFMKFMESSDRRLRKDANEGFYSSYQAHINTLGASLAAAVSKDVFYAKARRYESSLHGALDSDNIPVAVYHALIEATEANLTGFHDYVRLRKRLLKLEDIRPYDMICPLFPDQDYEVPYDAAVKEVIAACAPLGEEYVARLAEGSAGRWIDVFETEGKGSGAYSYSTYTVHPYVLMNYNGTVDNMFTLAHEMGHALHSRLANSTQCYPKARYSIFVAEVASTLNEGLLLQQIAGASHPAIYRYETAAVSAQPGDRQHRRDILQPGHVRSFRACYPRGG